MGKRPLTAWQQSVKRAFHEGKKHNKHYKFSQALRDAKKYYKKTAKFVKRKAGWRGGDEDSAPKTGEQTSVTGDEEEDNSTVAAQDGGDGMDMEKPPPAGGKRRHGGTCRKGGRRRGRKSRKSRRGGSGGTSKLSYSEL